MTVNKKWALLCLAGILFFSTPAWAAPFPNKTKEIVQDDSNYLKLEKADRDKFADAVKGFPDQYKVVVVESTQPEAQNPDQYAQLLYDNYNLDENNMLIVLDMDSQQLGVHPGQALVDKGATMEMLHEKITSYYEPYRNQKAYLQGIQMFISEVNAEFTRIQEKAAAAPAAPDASGTDAAQSQPQKSKSFWLSLPWWLYLIGLTFIALIVLFVYSFIRRRQVFAELDDTEDWKDQLVDQINQLEVGKPLRRSSGKLEAHYVELANRKEHLLHVRIIDIEMMIMEAEDACDRFRFSQSREMIEECRQALDAIQAELDELKEDIQLLSPQQRTQPERKQPLGGRAEPARPKGAAMPQGIELPQESKEQSVLAKQLESTERKLTTLRLDYGMSFHECKVLLEQAEELQKAAQEEAGDEETAAHLLAQSQELLNKVMQALERIPNLVRLIEKELPEELKQLEEGILAASSDGYDLRASDLDASLLQVKTVLKDARNALEEGSIDKAKALGDAFVISMEKTYQRIEKALVAGREAAASAAAPHATAATATAATAMAAEPHVFAVQDVGGPNAVLPNAAVPNAVAVPSPPPAQDTADAAFPAPAMAADAPTEAFDHAAMTAKPEKAEADWTEESALAVQLADLLDETTAARKESREFEDDERSLDPRPDAYRSAAYAVPKQNEQKAAGATGATAAGQHPDPEWDDEEEEEYELVIPKADTHVHEEPEVERFAAESEDDVLDELERINGSLVRIRQQLKRSYLPGIPEQLKYFFEQSVHNLAKIQLTMENYNYSLEEVNVLLNEAQELLVETEMLAERTITTCQAAEGAIQYTNRYRRQNRQVNELLTKAEQAFRNLEFQDALRLAEEARLVIEGGDSRAIESRWLLRKKKKGLGH